MIYLSHMVTFFSMYTHIYIYVHVRALPTSSSHIVARGCAASPHSAAPRVCKVLPRRGGNALIHSECIISALGGKGRNALAPIMHSMQ